MLPSGLVGCSEPSPELKPVLVRSIDALLLFDDHQAANGLDGGSDADLHELARTIAKEMNKEPRIYRDRIGINILRDGRIEGYRDRNANARQEKDEGQIFLVEIDADNGRLVATGNSGDPLTHRLEAFVGPLFSSGLTKRILKMQVQAKHRSWYLDDDSLEEVKVSKYVLLEEKVEKSGKDKDKGGMFAVPTKKN